MEVLSFLSYGRHCLLLSPARSFKDSFPQACRFILGLRLQCKGRKTEGEGHYFLDQALLPALSCNLSFHVRHGWTFVLDLLMRAKLVAFDWAAISPAAKSARRRETLHLTIGIFRILFDAVE